MIGAINVRKLLYFVFVGLVIGVLFSVGEYLLRLNTDDAQQFLPLFIRSQLGAILLLSSVAWFESLFTRVFTQKTFVFRVFVRALAYTLIITFWLSALNGVWMNYANGVSFGEGMQSYWSDEIYIINLTTIFVVLLLVISLGQIRYLFRKGELFNFIVGRYHKPKEIERVFCFIDLKGSTTIGEKLGHYRFGLFLKDYYSDITPALQQTKAEVHQYVGDEIILQWTYRNALRNNHMLKCFFLMKSLIRERAAYYQQKYGFVPEFKAGLHGGKIVVTWVGEVKKEIVYCGDVMNTTARIQEDCKRLKAEFLISGELLNRIPHLGDFTVQYLERTIPRGKEKAIKLYRVELNGA